jgi:hypothetical protein
MMGGKIIGSLGGGGGGGGGGFAKPKSVNTRPDRIAGTAIYRRSFLTD